jgi:hypothetical protein
MRPKRKKDMLFMGPKKEKKIKLCLDAPTK